MKNNLLLLALLTVLLAVTYIIHEQGDIKREQAFLSKHQLFKTENLGEMISFSNAAMMMNRSDNGVFKSQKSEFLIDSNKLEQALQILAPIQARRFLEEDELAQLNLELAFPHTNYLFKFEFENASISYLIGEKIQFSQDFYMKIQWKEQGQKELTRYVVATDVSLLEGVHSEDTYHRSEAKYMRLLSLLFLDEDFFADTRLLDLSSDSNMTSLMIENQQNRPFEVDFGNFTTSPAAPEGLLYNRATISGAAALLHDLQGERIIMNYDSDQLGSLVSTMTLQVDQQESVKLFLYDSYHGVEGLHAVSTNRQGLFPIDLRWSQLFLTNVQHFWDRSALQVPIAISQLIFESGEVLDFINEREKINPQLVERLESFFRFPADMVSQDKAENSLWQVKAEEKVYSFSLKEADLILTDHSRDLSFHFFRVEENLFPQDAKSWYQNGELSE
jgi:hypothetical protein